MNDVVKLSGARALIAKKMCESLQNTAQLSYHCDVDASSMVAAKNSWRAAGFNSVSFEDLIVEALARVLAEFKVFNGRLGERCLELVEEINISTAISSPNGLVAPAIFGVQEKSVEQIAKERKDLIERASTNKLTIPEMTGGTFTISNLGITPVKYFTPIINYPQVAILGLGQITKEARVADDDSVHVCPVMGLSMTADHQYIDGADAGAFLDRLKQVLESDLTLPA